MLRRILLTTALLATAGCTGRGSSSFSSGASTAASTSAVAGSTSTTLAAPPPTPIPAPHVALAARGLAIDGKPRALLGGEVQYYRVHDPNWDVAKTWQLWEQALDQLQAAGGTIVSTYVPWDYHEETEGQLDFTGVRDLDHFLELCWKRGLLVSIKPGPFINSEWPNGLGSFGAIPQWWKDKHQDALARKSNGDFFSFDLLGRPQGRQPSFFSPDFRQAAARWFSIVAPTIKKYIVDRPTIVLLQIDNETNFYFKSRFDSDYSVHGKKQFHDWLAAHGKPVVDPPTGPGDDQLVQDWFDAGWDGIADYHAFLRATWESLGVHEPDVLFTTNDSPHAMPMMDLLLWDAQTKSRSGVASIDAYPKQFPWTFDKPLDYPFLTSFFTKRFMVASGTRSALAAELQGGIFDLPLGIKIDIPLATTDHVLFQFFGHGGVVGSVYTFRGGLNRDGSEYFEMAPVDQNGVPTPRYDVFARWARNVVDQDLLASSDVESPVALVVGAHFDAPMSDVAGHPGWIQAKEAPAVYGWLEDAGVEPVVLDGATIKKGDLDRFQEVFYVDPDAAQDSFALALDDYVRKGGTLVNLLHQGRHDASWQPSSLLSGPGALLADGTLTGTYEEKLGIAFPPHMNFALPNGLAGALATSPFLGQYTAAPGVEVIAHDRTAPFGVDGAATGWRVKKGLGEVVFLGTNPGRVFRDAGYYDASAGDVLTARGLARWLMGEAGVAPILEVDQGKAQAFARRGPALVFVASRLAQADDVNVKLLDLSALGLDPKKTYRLVEELSGKSLGSALGADLRTSGFKVSLPAYGTAVVQIR